MQSKGISGDLRVREVWERPLERCKVPADKFLQGEFKFWVVRAGLEEARVYSLAIAHDDVLILLCGVMPEPSHPINIEVLPSLGIAAYKPNQFSVSFC